MEKISIIARVKKIGLEVGIGAASAIASAMPVYATTGAVGTATQEIKSGLGQIYNMITSIVLPIAAVALAVCGVKMLWGNQRSAEEAKGAAIKIVIALAIVYLAPVLIETVGSWFSSSGTGSVFG